MDKLVEKSCVDFADVLASKAPVPGGGGASAVVGALGVALGSMVGNLTLGRKKYAMYEEDIIAALKEAEGIRLRLLELVDEDALGFEPLQKAYSIPKDDPERPAIMRKVSIEACAVPLEIMRTIAKAVDILEEMLEKGSVTLLSDTGCGAYFAAAAIRAASLNIYINTKGLLGDDVDAILKETESIIETSAVKADNIASAVKARLM